MLEQFLAAPPNDAHSDRGAFQLAWRPVGSRPLTAALSAPVVLKPAVTRPPLPSFELL